MESTTPPELKPRDYILHLWRRSLLIVGLTVASLILTYLGVRYLASEMFETRALMLVRSQPRLSSIESEELSISPPSFESMFKSDQTIEFVRRQYNDMLEQGVFPPEANHQRLASPLEKLRTRFQTKSAANVDTTVSTKFSPVIELKCYGDTRDQALVLMELWLNYCLRTYGNLLNDEAEVLLESLDGTSLELQQRLKVLIEERENLVREKQLMEAKIASNYRLLTSAPIPEEFVAVGNDIMAFSMDSGASRTNVQVDQEAQTAPGIWEQLSALKVSQATGLELRSTDAPKETDTQQKIDQLQAKAEELINEVRSIVEITKDLAGRIAAVEVQLNEAQYAVRLLSSQHAYAQSLRRPNREGLGEGETISAEAKGYGTLRIMGKPALPQLRDSPKRTLVAALTAGGTFFFLLLLFCIECYLRNALRQEAAEKDVKA